MTSRCRSYAQPSQLYVPVYSPKVCPDPVNRDPKRNESVCKPILCRSEPLSHGEYLRKLVQNNGQAISTGTLLQQGSDIYKTTNWMGSTGSCVINTPVPKAQVTMDAGVLTSSIGAFASRGLRSKYDLVNTNAEATTIRLGGQAIAADTECSKCTVSGYSGPSLCNC